MDAESKREFFCRLLDHYGPVLSGRCREVMELYYAEDFSLSEIAENCGITRQGVHDAIKRGEQDLIHWEEQLHFAKKAKEILDLTDELKTYSADAGIRGFADAIADVIIKDPEVV